MDELVEYGPFAQQHGINRNWQNFALYSGYVHLAPYEDGQGRRLDDVGRCQFWQAFHARPEFVPCSSCPHALMVEAPAGPVRQATLWEQDSAGASGPPESAQSALARYKQEVSG